MKPYKLRADLEQALLQRGDRLVADALAEYQGYLQTVRGAVASCAMGQTTKLTRSFS